MIERKYKVDFYKAGWNADQGLPVWTNLYTETFLTYDDAYCHVSEIKTAQRQYRDMGWSFKTFLGVLHLTPEEMAPKIKAFEDMLLTMNPRSKMDWDKIVISKFDSTTNTWSVVGDSY